MNPSDPAPAPPPVAIVGMGCLFPRADGPGRYWANIRAGVDAITDVPETHWSADDYFDADPRAADRTYARRGGFLEPVDFPPLEFGVAPTAIEATDTTQLLGLMVARRALEDAGYGPPGGRPLDRERVSVILGVTGTLELVIPLGARLGHPVWRRALEESGVDRDTAEEVVRRISDSYVGWQEASFPGLLGNVVAGRIANRLDLRGTNCVVDAACASSLGAVNLALLELAAGRADLAVTGGMDTFNDIFMYMCFSKTPALSPTGDARPFDAAADGTILGEGLGVVVLKRLADARRDGDRVYAVIRSMGSSSDGKGQAVYAPSAAGQARALRQAYSLAGISPGTVGLVEAHGTGTRVGDATELEALEEVFGPARPGSGWCTLGSVKSQIGHTKAAAGAAGLIKAALALHHKVLPPTLKVRRPAGGLASGGSPFHVSTQARPWLSAGDEPRRAGVSAFGFGGSNFHCVLEEAGPEKVEIDWDGDVQILAFSADDRASLERELDGLRAADDWPVVRAAGARSRAAFRGDHRHRLLIVAARGDDAAALAAEARARLEGVVAPDGSPRIFVGQGPRPGKLGLLFPGQGSQYVNMAREIACLFPAMHEALAGMDRASADRVGERIFPPPAFDDAGRAAHESALRDTRFAQPAIGAVSLGLLRVLEGFGVRADVAAGHSFGELTALRAAGRIDDAAFFRLAHCRGELMARCAADGTGSMIAAFAPIADVETLIEDHGLDLVVANRNAPRQCVLSGPSGEIERGLVLLERQGIAARGVPVSAAFHSKLVAPARGPFRRALEAVELRRSPVPVLANVTARPYPDDADAARDLLADQLARPVEFVALVEEMYRLGTRTFLEVGPDRRLTGLVRSILEGRDHAALSADASRGSAGNLVDLACALATLASLGYAVDLTPWDAGYAGQPATGAKPGLTVRISGANARPRGHSGVEPGRNGTAEADRYRYRAGMAGSAEPRFTAPDDRCAAPAALLQPIHHAENDRPMNPLERPETHHRNGQAAATAPLASVSEPVPERTNPPAPRTPPDDRSPAGLAAAIQAAQENVLALERLAEQTALLHRQFLEGQEKTQATFLRLIEHQQNLAGRLIGVGEPAAPAVEPAKPRLAESNGKAAGIGAEALPPAVQPAAPARAAEPVNAARPVPAFAVAEPAPPVADAITDSAAAALISVVGEKTGYPAEVLELSMRLDDDLGIDSIKRVEILSALQDRFPDLPAPAPDRLASFQTLGDIAAFLGGRRTDATDIPAPPRPETNDHARALLEVVADKTGYPAEMLELSMRLDDDLGIDSIKRVEILSALQDRFPAMPAAGPEQIGKVHTLADIVGLMGGPEKAARGEPRSPDSAPVLREGEPFFPAPAAVPAGDEALIAGILIHAVAEKTGYPAEMLELSMRLDDDLGIDSIKRVEILSAVQDRLPGVQPIGPDQAGSLTTLGEIVAFLAQPAAASVSVPGRAPSANGHGSQAHAAPLSERDEPACGVTLRVLEPIATPLETPERRERVPLPPGGTIGIVAEPSPLADALRSELERRGFRTTAIANGAGGKDDLCGLVILAPEGRVAESFVVNAFRAIRAAAPALERAAAISGASLLTVSRLDGRFGVEGLWPDADPTSGVLAGLAKTAGREWPAVHCKALDLAAGDETPDRAAAAIVEELLARGPVEVGYDRGERSRLDVRPRREAGGAFAARARLRPDDVVVISGGARGITAEVAVALAQRYRATLVLLGRSPEPADREDEALAACEDEATLLRYLLSGPERGRSPRAIAERARQILAEREIRRNLGRMAAAGSRVVYRSVDVRDASSVAGVMGWARSELGPIRGLIHGAGVLADRRIVDQTDEQFRLVYETKVAGLLHICDAIDLQGLEFLVLFSSSTARFGRTGQVAYAAANEYLNKWAQRAAVQLPDCRVVAFNWGPWEGGMVGEGLQAIFEKEGLHLIPAAAGARVVIAEIEASDTGPGPVEIVVLADRVASAQPVRPAETRPSPPAREERRLEPVLTRRVDLKSVPVLADHVIDGHAVLPMAIIVEWLAEAAVQRNPGLVVRGVDDLRLFKGLVLETPEGSEVAFFAGKAARVGDEYRVPVELRGTLAGGRAVTHARAEVILATRHAAGVRNDADRPLGLAAVPREDPYRRLLFHGPLMQGIEQVDGCDERGVAGLVRTSPEPAAWLSKPARSRWLTDPLAVDSAFQLVVLWTRQQLRACSLPTAVGRYRQFRPSFGPAGVRVRVAIRQSSAARAVADIDFLDERGELVARIESYECVVDASLNQAFRRNQLAASSPLSVS